MLQHYKPPDLSGNPFVFAGDGIDFAQCEGWRQRSHQSFMPSCMNWGMPVGQRPCASSYVPDFTGMELLPYAGIGSRNTPLDIQNVFSCLGVILANYGYTLRSGGAPGADQAFDRFVPSNKRKIFVPWNGFEGYPLLYTIPCKAYEVASIHHDAWDRLKPAVKDLMARNSMQILGKDLDKPSKFTLCWTPDGCESIFMRSKITGGTGQAIAVSSTFGVPVINFANRFPIERLAEFIGVSSQQLHDSIRIMRNQLLTS